MNDIDTIKFNGLVENDESLFGRKTKYVSLRKINGKKDLEFWFDGEGYQSTQIIPRRQQETSYVKEIILDNIETGSTNYSDGWAAYKCLPSTGYKHFAVEHKQAFKAIYYDTATREIQEVHTNCIKGAWKHAKDHFNKLMVPQYSVLKDIQYR